MKSSNIKSILFPASADNSRRRRGHFLTLFRLSFAVFLVALLFYFFDISKIMNRLVSVGIESVVFACFILAIQFLLSTVRWHYILHRHSVGLRYRDAFSIYGFGALANLILVNAIAGLSVRGALLARVGAGASRTVGVLLMERLSTVAGLALCLIMGAGISLKLLPRFLEQIKFSYSGLWFVALGVFLATVLAVAFWQFSAVRQFVAQIKESFLSAPVVGLLILLSATIVILGFASVAILAQGMNIHIEPLFFIAVMPAVAFVASLPISIGGWGVREGMMVAGLSLFNVPADAAVALSIVYGLAGVLVVCILGAAAVLLSSLGQEKLKFTGLRAYLTRPNQGQAVSSSRKSDLSAILGVAAVGIIAVTLNIQSDISLAGVPIRFSLSDIAAVLLFPLAALLVVRQRNSFLQDSTVWVLLSIGVACLAMTWGLAIGLSRSGWSDSWALAKYVGWYSLLYYALIGAVLAGANPEKLPLIFVRVFTLALGLMTLAYIGLAVSGISWPGNLSPRFSGLTANPNAFGFALVCGVILTLFCAERTATDRHWLCSADLLTGLLCAGIFFTRSVAAMLALMVVALIFIGWRRQIFSLLIISFVTLVLFHIPDVLNRFLGHYFPWLLAKTEVFDMFDKVGAILPGQSKSLPGMYELSLGSRLETNGKAVLLWLEQPVFGIGLGRFLQAERASDPSSIMQIHNTPLWLLTEFGLVGFVAFVCLFAGLAVVLWRGWRKVAPSNPRRANLIFAGLTILVVWAGMSLAHELLYQRVAWFIVGLCVAVALAPMPEDQTQCNPPTSQ